MPSSTASMRDLPAANAAMAWSFASLPNGQVEITSGPSSTAAPEATGAGATAHEPCQHSKANSTTLEGIVDMIRNVILRFKDGIRMLASMVRASLAVLGLRVAAATAVILSGCSQPESNRINTAPI